MPSSEITIGLPELFMQLAELKPSKGKRQHRELRRRIGEALAKLRTEKEISIECLVIDLGTTSRVLKNVERGSENISNFEFILRYLTALHLESLLPLGINPPN